MRNKAPRDKTPNPLKMQMPKIGVLVVDSYQKSQGALILNKRLSLVALAVAAALTACGGRNTVPSSNRAQPTATGCSLNPSAWLTGRLVVEVFFMWCLLARLPPTAARHARDLLARRTLIR